LVQASTLGYKTNHRLSKGVEKRGGRSHWWRMIINKNKSRIEKLTLFHDSSLEIVNKEKLTMKAKIIHKNCPNKKTNHLSITDRIDDWFFGSRRKESTQSAPTIQNQIEDYINNVDIELLMETYDMLVDTSKQLKPLMKEITPFFIDLVKNSNPTKMP
jgi:hypothetical protein